MIAALEPFTRALPEIFQLLPEHYKAHSIYADQYPLDPDMDLYLSHDANGRLLFVALRHEGKMVGYMTAFVHPFNYSKRVLTLTMDMVYVVPALRGRFGFRRMWRVASKEAQRRGVSLYLVHEGQSPVVGRVLEREGFVPNGRVLTRSGAGWASGQRSSGPA